MKIFFISIILSILPVFAFSGNILVINNNDAGEGSLRYAIDNSVSGDTIAIACGLTAIDLQTGTLVIDKTLTILGCHTVISRKGDDKFRIVEITGEDEITVKFKEVSFSSGQTETIDEEGMLNGQPGGGIYVNNPAATLILEECEVFGNETGYGDRRGNGGKGAGIFVNGGALELYTCSIYGNVTGNGFLNNKCNDGGDGGNGGGIAIENGNISVYNSTFNNNITGTGKQTTCSGTKGMGYGGAGGGIWLKESVGYFENTTFYENSTGSSDSTYAGFGGAVYSGTNSEIQIINCTITKNSTGLSNIDIFSQGGGIFNEPMSVLIMKNSIVADNFLGNSINEESPDIFGEIISEGNNLLGITEGSSGITNAENNDIAGTLTEPVDAALYPLTSNGGLTKTCPLNPESPAVNAGSANSLGTDQRNYPRESTADIGAFEFGVSPIITNVYAVSSDGQYSAGDQILIAVEFNEPVWVIGSFEMLLETGTYDRFATYYGGSGDATILFEYDVLQGDVSPDLDVESSLSLMSCNNCLIQNFELYNAVLILPKPGEENSLSYNSDIVIRDPNNINTANNEMFSIYPNPVTNILNVTIPETELNSKIELYNSIGALVLSKDNYKAKYFSYDMTNYSSGVYFIKISTSQESKTYKFIVR